MTTVLFWTICDLGRVVAGVAQPRYRRWETQIYFLSENIVPGVCAGFCAITVVVAIVVVSS